MVLRWVEGVISLRDSLLIYMYGKSHALPGGPFGVCLYEKFISWADTEADTIVTLSVLGLDWFHRLAAEGPELLRICMISGRFGQLLRIHFHHYLISDERKSIVAGKKDLFGRKNFF